VVQGRAGTRPGESLVLPMGPPKPRSLLQLRHPTGPLGRLGERGCKSLTRLRILDYLRFSWLTTYQCEFQGTGEGGTGANPRRPPGEARDIQRAAQAPLGPPINSSPGPGSEPPGPGRGPVTVGPALSY
jgi:hypothetical protein